MNTLRMTEDFMKWLASLKDLRAKANILARIDRAKKGNFGDYKRLNEHLYEMRISVGAGYRIYYMQEEQCVYLIIAGGNKKSQSKDIEKANSMLLNLLAKDAEDI